MTVWILQLYDRSFSFTLTVGVYTSFEKACVAKDILMKRLREKGIENLDQQCNTLILPRRTDSFDPEALKWLSR